MPRDPRRIPRILKRIEKLWERYPDQRLGQLLQNYAGFTREDNFYREDYDTEVALIDYMLYEKHGIKPPR